MTRNVTLAIGSVCVGAIVLALKFWAYLLTGSVALYSDALESIVNVAAATAALIALWLAAKPADHNHPYGHHKAEYISAVIEGALIVVAAISIFREAYLTWLHLEPLPDVTPGLIPNGIATLLNAAWGWLLVRRGKSHRSPVLLADGRHLLSDVVTSIGVIVGVALAWASGWTILDPLIAVMVALYILWVGWTLMKESVGGLMDEAPAPKVLERIRAIISQQGHGALEAHDLRTRRAGRATFIDFHLVVPGSMTVRQAHDITDRIEAALTQEFEGALITIHMEPDEKAEHSGIVVL